MNVGVWGSCISYDFVGAFERLSGIKAERNYKFRIPTVNYLYPTKSYGLPDSEISKIRDENSLRNFKMYQAAVDWESFFKSEFLVIDLYKDTYNLFRIEDGFTIVGPEFGESKIDYPKYPVVNSGSEEHFAYLEKSIKAFSQTVDKLNIPVFLIDFPGAINQSFCSDTGFDLAAYDAYLVFIRRVNDLFCKSVSCVRVVGDVETTLYDKNHIYGVGPQHMLPEFWDQMVLEAAKFDNSYVARYL